MKQEVGSAFWAELKISARIDAPSVAKLLGFAEHDIPVLVRSGLLKALGNPAQNATKWFSAAEIINLGSDKEWLDKATKRISMYWLKKRRTSRVSGSLEVNKAKFTPQVEELDGNGAI